MNNGEIKNYKGATIKKVNGKTWLLNNRPVAGYDEAKKMIDIEDLESKALDEIDDYVTDLGGWL